MADRLGCRVPCARFATVIARTAEGADRGITSKTKGSARRGRIGVGTGVEGTGYILMQPAADFATGQQNGRRFWPNTRRTRGEAVQSG
jgi:hypothetical protein